ncbi:hypothetical protein JAAARDRAFT_37753 [Jaapia argillacea MUCL 33604]|uniref:N-acetyltransferase domain-containing protein n=1 Tax=Jaapia argillacea MUCL 33604 TaxID=933084 RepID=A0A067PVB9_9AGAM|nr:hypothetical protein JAAARDRAFT_37753 [Jaapia argillacea MUCL 33604]
MSAYGAIKAPTRTSDPLPSTIWSTKALPSQSNYITLHHLTLSTALTHLGLIDYLWREFAEEVERGLTYPQEMLQGEVFTKEMFEAYFFAGDAFVGIVGSGKVEEGLEGGVREVEGGVDKAAAGRKWEDCVAGFYYVKPNYPGRSSHICNAGFVVPSTQRGSGFGRLLAKSYVHYAPKLGYQASVFNLVYVNNIASVK